jgi:hypothetical protein
MYPIHQAPQMPSPKWRHNFYPENGFIGARRKLNMQALDLTKTDVVDSVVDWIG